MNGNELFKQVMAIMDMPYKSAHCTINYVNHAETGSCVNIDGDVNCDGIVGNLSRRVS